MKFNKKFLIIIGVIMISLNLRAAITALGPLTNILSEQLNFSTSVIGFLTTLPLITFAIISPLISNITRKIGSNKTMFIGLLFLIAGIIIRSYFGIAGIFIGTFFIGCGIGIGNVLVPSIIKENFENTGAMISVYTTGLCVSAAIGAGNSFSLATKYNLGWKNSLAIWGILAIVAIVLWLPLIFSKTNQVQENKKSTINIWKNSLAWKITILMGVQSLIFYSLVAWLNEILIFRGFSNEFASNMAIIFQLFAVPATLVIPPICDKLKNQKALMLAVSFVYFIGLAMYFYGMNGIIVTIGTALMALGMGGTISLAIAFLSLRSSTPEIATQLSGMSQSAGYLLASIGPVLLGYLYDISQSWNLAFYVFVIAFIIQTISGYMSSVDKKI